MPPAQGLLQDDSSIIGSGLSRPSSIGPSPAPIIGGGGGLLSSMPSGPSLFQQNMSNAVDSMYKQQQQQQQQGQQQQGTTTTVHQQLSMTYGLAAAPYPAAAAMNMQAMHMFDPLLQQQLMQQQQQLLIQQQQQQQALFAAQQLHQHQLQQQLQHGIHPSMDPFAHFHLQEQQQPQQQVDYSSFGFPSSPKREFSNEEYNMSGGAIELSAGARPFVPRTAPSSTVPVSPVFSSMSATNSDTPTLVSTTAAVDPLSLAASGGLGLGISGGSAGLWSSTGGLGSIGSAFALPSYLSDILSNDTSDNYDFDIMGNDMMPDLDSLLPTED